MKVPKSLFFYLFVLFVFTSLFFHFLDFAYAACEVRDYSSPEEYQQAIEECQLEIDARTGAHSKNKEDLASLERSLANTKKLVESAQAQINNLEEEIFDQEVDLEYQKEILAARVRSYYKKSRQYSPFLLFLASANATDLIRELSYRKIATDEDKEVIMTISRDISQLVMDKEEIEEKKIWLDATKNNIDKQAKALGVEVDKVEDYFSEVSGKIAQLSAKQQALLAQKLAGLNLPTSLGAGPLYCTDDRNLEPGFRPAFAFYTFGIPHRVGMNQYGAYGRANAGQSYQDILRAYYEGIVIEKRPNINIRVQGYGEMSLEQYLLGIYEIPESWPIEALKAQVVAARSYALSYTDNGAKEICTTQSCQVYKGGNKGGNWDVAVKATEGEVAVHSGQVITAWYASTSGGYTFMSSDVGWSSRPWTKRMRDTNGDVSSFSDLFAKAYDKDSPCFYAAQGWRKEYGNSAWLKSEEVADIANVILLSRADSSTGEHLYQTDKAHPYGGEIWNEERVKNELRSRNITPYNSVSEVSVSVDFGLGRTNNVSVSGDAETKSFSNEEFKDFFNLRAPANIQIVGPLFNVEKK